MKRILSILIFTASFQASFAGGRVENTIQPKLIIGIVVDQMRYDYLYRFYRQYSENGLKRLLSEGMNFTYAQYNYIPTSTGPGHASIYTGSTPYYHGVISNDWYDRQLKKVVYCTGDPDVLSVGVAGNTGRMSPKNLLSTTMTDQLRMSDNGRSRVFSISIKDRAAILPGGRMANAAYWYDGKTGNFISSSWYMKELPGWLTRFNQQKLPLELMNKDWTAEPAKDFSNSLPDEGNGEADVFREGKTVFPHRFANLPDSIKQEYIKTTPSGNELLTDLLIALLKNEKAGQGGNCDFIAVSFSSTDYIGHAYGPNSMEIMDTYLKFDRQIGRILDTLDILLGKGNYLLFLTADHGVKPNSAYLSANHISAGHVSRKSVRTALDEYSKSLYGTSRIVEALQDNQVYLNHYLLDSLKLNESNVTEKFVGFMRTSFPFMGQILTRENLLEQAPARSRSSFIINGYNINRSGNISFGLVQNFLISDGRDEGTTHESMYNYDTHVPLIFFGWHIKAGESGQEVFVEDIAPTVCNLVHIQEPDAAMGVPIIK
jgi:predicted AlkP superfamily pyrophosphatase or phosphodiesterase